jgi:hypothetical protein
MRRLKIGTVQHATLATEWRFAFRDGHDRLSQAPAHFPSKIEQVAHGSVRAQGVLRRPGCNVPIRRGRWRR